MISPETLRRFSLFAGLDPAWFKDIAMVGEEVKLAQGEWLFHEGDDADALYLVLNGSVELKINLDVQSSRQADISTVSAGEVIGWSALVEPEVYTLGAVAASDVQLVRLDAVGLRKLMEQNCEFGFHLMRQLAKVLGQRLTNLRVQFVSLVV
jgi:CRP/FNR family transcriptional regulator, cyclic AMP receptor protein